MKLRCYCCGEKIDGQVALVTMSPDSVDRVFVVLPDHLERLDDTVHFQVMAPMERTASGKGRE